MVVFVYALLVVLFLAPGWRMLRILTIVAAALVAMVALWDPIPIGLVPAILLHSAVFFGLGALIVRLMTPKARAKGGPNQPPVQSDDAGV